MESICHQHEHADISSKDELVALCSSSAVTER